MAVDDSPSPETSKEIRLLERKLRRLRERNSRIEQLNELNQATSLALRRRLEQDVERRERMLAELSYQKELAVTATQAKAAFLANVSHEIRTPMNGVMGMLELLRGTPLTTEQQELSETAHTSANLLLQLIDDLLNFSKIEAGRMDLEQVPFAARQCIDECIDIVRLKAHRQGLRLYVAVDPDCPYGLIGDAARLRQIILNLLNNAVKFTHRGEVRLTARYDPEQSTLHVSVVDSGVGIDPDRLAQIFEPFSQADSSVTRRFGGTGLGLSISQSLAQAMGGDIEVQSEPGRGSTFSVWIKASKSEMLPSVPRQRVAICIADEQEALNLEGILQTLGCQAWFVEPTEISSVAREHWLYTDLPVSALPTARRLVRIGAVQDADDGAFSAVPLSMRAVADRLRGPQRRPEGASTPTSAALDTPNIRVLVAEDNRVNQAVLRRFLEREGHTVEIAEDGVAALECVASATYDLVLMDCQMPRMCGFEATRRLRSDEKQADLPIVAITANAAEEDRKACLDAGMDAFLTKPVQLDALRAVIRDLPRRSARANSDTSPVLESGTRGPSKN